MNITLEDMESNNLTTYYLKADNKEALWTALEAAGLAYKEYDSDNSVNYEWISESNMLDVIGTLYRETGTMLTNNNGIDYPETVAISGYHANLRENLTDEQKAALPLVDAPDTPQRKWAGD
jgi:hypothetical protein